MAITGSTFSAKNAAGTTFTILCASDATNVITASVPTDGVHFVSNLFDLDSGAGSDYQMGVVLRTSASGGSVEAGTASKPLYINVVNVGGVAAVQLPAGQAAMAASAPVVIASDQSAIAVAGASADNATNSTAKVPVIGAKATAADPAWTEGRMVPASADLAGYSRVLAKQTGTWTMAVTGGTDSSSVGATGATVPANATQMGISASGNLATPTSSSPTTGQVAMHVDMVAVGGLAATLLLPGQANMANSTPVVIASDQSAVPVSGSVADNATNPGGKVPTLPVVATASAPTLTEGHIAPLSSDLKGKLRALCNGIYTAAGVTLSDGVSNAIQMDVSGHLLCSSFAKATAAAPTYTEGSISQLSTDLAGNLRATLAAGTAAIGTVNVGSDVATSGSTQAGVAPSSATQLTSAAATKGVTVKADDDNTDSIYLGFTSGVTADKGVSTSGWRLKAGQSAFLPVSNANLIYIIRGAASQNYTVIVL